MDVIPTEHFSYLLFHQLLTQPLLIFAIIPCPCCCPTEVQYPLEGSYFTAGIDTNGCADTTTTILTIYGADSIADSVLICQQNGYTLPGGAFVDSSGVYIDSLSNIAGCDSTVTTYLTVLPETDESYNTSILLFGDSIVIHDLFLHQEPIRTRCIIN